MFSKYLHSNKIIFRVIFENRRLILVKKKKIICTYYFLLSIFPSSTGLRCRWFFPTRTFSTVWNSSCERRDKISDHFNENRENYFSNRSETSRWRWRWGGFCFVPPVNSLSARNLDASQTKNDKRGFFFFWILLGSSVLRRLFFDFFVVSF